jgi:hypothetical protein
MDAKKIERISKLNQAIENFKCCYEGNELWGVIDGPVPYEKLIEFLINNTEFHDIAQQISKLDK